MSRSAFTPDSSVVAEVLPSPNNGERRDGRRPDMILMHYTGMADAEAALELLRARGSDVSCHYFVFEDGRIVQMVPEGRRALRINEFCTAYGVSRSTVYKLAIEKKLRLSKIGGRTLIKIEDAEACLNGELSEASAA